MTVPVTLEFWYMLPAAILIATTAMVSGVEGATFFSPLFILALGLPPEIAIDAGLIPRCSASAVACTPTTPGS